MPQIMFMTVFNKRDWITEGYRRVAALISCVLVGCAWLCMVIVSLLAGSEPVVRPIFHFDMHTDDPTQTSARTDIQHPWLR